MGLILIIRTGFWVRSYLFSVHMFLWIFLPCLSVVAADITSYVVDSESSTAVDDDSCTSSPQTNPCKTLQYLLANIEPKNVEVTLNQGTYNLTANITNVTYAENFTLTGSNEPTLQCSSNKTMINFISPKKYALYVSCFHFYLLALLVSQLLVLPLKWMKPVQSVL